MIPAASFSHIDGLLNNEQVQRQSGIAEGFPLETRTVGFLVFDQNYVRGPIQDLVGNLDMINVHSGTYMHFFLCGVSRYGANEEGAKNLGKMGGVPLYHNAQATYSFIKAFECRIPGWHYQMGFDLVLVDVMEDGAQRVLDFPTAVYFRVDELINWKVVERPSDLLGKLIKFAREGRLTGAAGLRAELAMLFGKNWLAGLLLGMFPKSVRTLARGGIAVFGGTATPD